MAVVGCSSESPFCLDMWGHIVVAAVRLRSRARLWGSIGAWLKKFREDARPVVVKSWWTRTGRELKAAKQRGREVEEDKRHGRIAKVKQVTHRDTTSTSTTTSAQTRDAKTPPDVLLEWFMLSLVGGQCILRLSEDDLSEMD